MIPGYTLCLHMNLLRDNWGKRNHFKKRIKALKSKSLLTVKFKLDCLHPDLHSNEVNRIMKPFDKVENYDAWIYFMLFVSFYQ